ncbi:MAG: hypothetical protein KFF50_08925 [Desulfatitalea sp.]|nr:hypothetical protein [Desulfatitalea sp.]
MIQFQIIMPHDPGAVSSTPHLLSSDIRDRRLTCQVPAYQSSLRAKDESTGKDLDFSLKFNMLKMKKAAAGKEI